MKNFLNISEVKFSNRTAFLLILTAYVFSLAVRYYYYVWASSIPEFLWHGTLMINNPDGYFYASGAKELLNHSHVLGDLNPYHSLPSILTALIVKLFPFLTLDQVILWMPAVFGSLVVVPVFLIGRELKNDILGFAAALISAIAWSYYNRTMVGYYDTDMLVIVLFVFIIWGIVRYFESNDTKMIFVVPLMIIIYEWWYPQCRDVLIAVLFMALFYAFFRKKFDDFIFLFISFLVLSKFDFYINFIFYVIFYLVYKYKKEIFYIQKNLLFLYFFIFILLLIAGNFEAPIGKILTYLKISRSQEGFHFYTTYKTIREASAIPYSLVAHRISGNWPLFILSAIGYILMLIRYPVMIITIPSVILGIMAHKLGLRFTIYAVPFFALGFAYLVVLVSEYVARNFINEKTSKFAKIFLPLVLILPSLYVNIAHAVAYKVPTVFLKPEVEALDKLGHIASREDYAITWWDYGYPIRYYAGLKTVIDGGKHEPNMMYSVSAMLINKQIFAANLARLAVEYTDKSETAKELGKEIKDEGFIKEMMKKYGFKDPNEFLKALNNPDFKLPEKTRNIYFYLPFRMINIYPTVAIFSSINLKTGKVKEPFIIPTQIAKASPKGIVFTNGFVLRADGMLQIQNNLIPVNSFYISDYKNGRFVVAKQTFHPDSNVYVLWYRPFNKVLIVDRKIFNSTFIQLFFLQHYNPEIFKPVILSPFVKIYKLEK